MNNLNGGKVYRSISPEQLITQLPEILLLAIQEK